MVSKVVGYVFIVVFIWFCIRYIERKSIFYPTRQIEFTPKEVGLVYEDVSFKASDDVALHGWFVPAEGSNKTVLFCHGNAGNISHRIDMAKLFNDADINILNIDVSEIDLNKKHDDIKKSLTHIGVVIKAGEIIKKNDLINLKPQGKIFYSHGQGKKGDA